MKVLRIELRPDAKRKPIPVRGDFIDVDAARTTADISRVRVAFNDSDQYATLKTIAGSVIRSGFGSIALDWDDSENNKILVLVIGDQMVKTMTRELDVRLGDARLVEDRIGLAREDTLTQVNRKLSQPTVLKSEDVVIDNSGGSSDVVQQLFTASTPSRYATIYRDPDDSGKVYVGDSEKQVFPLEPGGRIETRISDLSNIYVRVPAGVKCTLHVLWEAG